MNRIQLLSLLLLLFLLFSCEKAETFWSQIEGDKVVVSLSLDSFRQKKGTKTYISEAGTCKWKSGDRMGLFSNNKITGKSNSSQLFLSLKEDVASSTAFFSSSIGWQLVSGGEYNYIAYYPYDKCNSRDSIVLNYIGQSQIVNGELHNAEYDFIYSSPSDPVSPSSATFECHHINALANFEIEVPDAYASVYFSKVCVKASSQLFAKTASYNVDSVFTYGYPSIKVSEYSDTMELDLTSVGIKPTGKMLSIYLMMLPAELSGEEVTVELYPVDGNEYLYGTVKVNSDQEAGGIYSYAVSAFGTKERYYYWTHTCSLAPGTSYSFPNNYVQLNQYIDVCVEFPDGFQPIEIGRGKTLPNGHWMTISSSSISIQTYMADYSPSTQTYTHNLSISDYLDCTILCVGNDQVLTMSNGSSKKIYSISWNGTGAPYVKNNGSKSINITFKFTAKDALKTIWVLGDSYISWYNPRRWAYYLYSDGYTNYMLDHLRGGVSSQLYDSFVNDLTFGTPKYAFWCLGMNDASDGTTPNSDWLYYAEKFADLCEAKGIIPVFSTIPSVKVRYHEKKNEWVRNSGYRYVDLAEAVGAQPNGTWYEGMLGTDGVHPTELGAQAMVKKIKQEFPEILK